MAYWLSLVALMKKKKKKKTWFLVKFNLNMSKQYYAVWQENKQIKAFGMGF